MQDLRAYPRTPHAVGLDAATARDPDDPEGELGVQHVLAHVKSNLGLLSTSLALVLEPVTLAGADRIETVRLVEQGGSRFTGSGLLGEQGQGPSKLERATSLLVSELAEGPKRVAQLQAKQVSSESR